MRPARLLAALAVSAALGACAAPPVPRPRADVPAEWQAAPAGALGAAPDLTRWWRAFGDVELDRLVERALANNLTLQAAAYRVRAARALTRQSESEFRPLIGAHTFAEPTPDSSASYFQAGFDAKWELGFFGRAESSARVAAADVGLAEADADSARVSVVAEVARTYVELRAAERRFALLEAIAAHEKTKTTLVATRERLRLASAADRAGSEAAAAVADAALAYPKLAIEQSRRKLAVLLGESEPPADLVASGTPPDLGALSVAEAPADLLRTRPDVRRAEETILKAAGALGIARADLFPRLALGGSLTYSARVVGHTRLSDADGIVTAGPLIDVPIFDWGARRAVANARDAELQAVVLAYREAVVEGVAEVETALAALERARERADGLRNAMRAQAESEAATATLRRVGLADDVALGDAAVARLEAEAELARAEEARNLAFVALYKALGGAPLPEASAP